MTTGRRLTRREVLAQGAGALAGLALAGCTAGTRGATTTTGPTRPRGISQVEHVVMVMLENRSFDHYFGSYRGVLGFDDHPGGSLGAFAQSWPGGPASSGGRLLPFHLDTATQRAECTHDLSHAWTAQHECWHGGQMDRFVTTHTSAAFEGAAQGVLTMGYYTRQDLAFHYALADAFTICDRYHCSVLGPTHPNRLHWISATLDPDGRAGGPVLTTTGNPLRMFSVSWKTMPEALSAGGVSWKVYNPAGVLYEPPSPLAMTTNSNPLLYFEQFRNDDTDLHRRAFSSTYPSDFADDVRRGRLPQVSWVIPAIGQDEHPPAPPSTGEWFTAQIVATLTANPEVWSKTVLFVSFDENDGFFDHVPPPVPPAGTPGEYLTQHTLPPAAGGVAGPIGLGVRVPMLVVSPFSRGGFVCSDVFDHTSQLRFLETRFGVEVPNLTAWRRGATGDLTTALNFDRSDTSLPQLPATSEKAPVVTRECEPLQLLELDVPTPPYPVPTSQQMPVQEQGSPRRNT